MKKIISIIALILVLTPGASALSPLPSTFSDVYFTTDYHAAIEWMVGNEIIEGYPDGTFKPNQCVNRAEFLKMLYLTSEVEQSQSNATPFSDIKDEEWYFPYVSSAYSQGIIEGYPDETFRPGNCVNRVEAIKMAILMFEAHRLEGDSIYFASWFSDLDSNAWYYELTLNAIGNDLVGLQHAKDLGDSLAFYPEGDMTRKEVAELLYRTESFTDATFAEDNLDLLTVQPSMCSSQGESYECPDSYSLSLVLRNYVNIDGNLTGFLYLELIENNFGGDIQDYQAVDSVLLNKDYNPFLGDGGQIGLQTYGYFRLPQTYNSVVSIESGDEFVTVIVEDRNFVFAIDTDSNNLYHIQ